MSCTQDPSAWAREMFGHAELGDPRRTKRLVDVAERLAGATGQSVAQACGDDAAAQEGAYRLLRNDHIQPEAIAEAGFLATVAKAAGCGTLLALEDSTTLSYTHGAAEQLGDLGGPKHKAGRGLWVHSVLLVEALRGHTVGLVEQAYWQRAPQARGTKRKRKQRPYEAKESFKWQRASEHVRARVGAELMARIVSVCDREADVYEYLNYKLEQGERFVVRAMTDRALQAVETDAGVAHLRARLAQATSCGTAQVRVEQRGGRKAREAQVTVRATQVQLRRPTNLKGGAAWITVNAVMAREEAPPAHVKPLDWVLLTSEPIASQEEVGLVLSYYRLRWRIEEFHKAWKTGAGVERCRLQQRDNILRLAAILACLGVRQLQLAEWLADQPDASCEEVLTPEEWRVLWLAVEKRKPLPRRAPPVRWAYQALGRLAGWGDTKHTGRVGAQTLCEGWLNLEARMEGFHAAAALAAREKK